jgi:hypothetical protein
MILHISHHTAAYVQVIKSKDSQYIGTTNNKNDKNVLEDFVDALTRSQK